MNTYLAKNKKIQLQPGCPCDRIIIIYGFVMCYCLLSAFGSVSQSVSKQPVVFYHAIGTN